MSKDVAIFLDLDNVLIGSIEANLTFDINLILEYVEALTSGRLVFLRAYGDWRQRAQMTKELATAGFELISAVRLSSNSKNLADMQMVVDAMSTLVDGHDFGTYTLITGDRDLAPLVQEMRKRGKQVIGVGVKHTSSQRLVQLCDHFVYYDQLAAAADQLLEDQITDLLKRAMEQLLQDQSRVPASLLKQRVQALSKGVFGRSPQGKRNFSKLLLQYPQLLQVVQEGSTLYVRRPVVGAPRHAELRPGGRQMSEDKIRLLLQRAMDDLLQEDQHARASLLKQRMQDLSDGDFEETLQGDKNFRKFLDRYKEIVTIEQEGSTLYIRRANDQVRHSATSGDQQIPPAEARSLLEASVNELMIDHSQVRASLLKQRMQELSNGSFDETQLGVQNFRQFLERYPTVVQVQQKGTTLLVRRPDNFVEPDELHLRYRSTLKKRGLRVVPSPFRLRILQDVITLLQSESQMEWRQMVNHIASYYQSPNLEDISKSFVNDVLRVARRSLVIDVQNGGSLATARVSLLLAGDRLFQDAVIHCDLTYLREIQNLGEPFDLEQASIALYETVGHTRYLKVILNRFSNNGRNAG